MNIPGQKSGLDLLKLVLWMIVSHLVGDGNRTRILWKSIK